MVSTVAEINEDEVLSGIVNGVDYGDWNPRTDSYLPARYSFRDMAGKMNKSLLDVGGSVLVVSQFTLAAETKGNRPGFSTAAPPDLGRKLYEHFSEQLRGHGLTVANGEFGADMQVSLVNDGPVTIWLDTEDR